MTQRIATPAPLVGVEDPDRPRAVRVFGPVRRKEGVAAAWPDRGDRRPPVPGRGGGTTAVPVLPIVVASPSGGDVTDAAPDGGSGFDAFVTARYSALVALARYLLRDPHKAQDVVQEVLGRAFARWSRIGRLEAPDAYVRRMVVRECLSWRRRRSRVELPGDDVPALPVGDGSDTRAERDAMLGLLARLSDRQRAVLVLRHYEDLSDHQIAELLGIREATVRGHAMTGLERLRGLIVAADPGAGTLLGRYQGETS